jgi:hypothetical protein
MNRGAGVRARMPGAARPGGAPVPRGGPGPALPPQGLREACGGPGAPACQEKPQCAIHNGHCDAENEIIPGIGKLCNGP